MDQNSEAEIKKELDRHFEAAQSLVSFRKLFFPSKEDVEAAEFHHRWSEALLFGRRHIAIQAFRESAKTQIVSRANLLHAICYPMEKRSYIVLICANKTNAGNKLREIMRHLSSMAGRRIAETISKWTEKSGDALEVETTRGFSVRIESYGKGSAVRGLSWQHKRPDLILIDDPQDAKDAMSEQVCETDWEWFLSDVMFLGENSRIFMIGNNLGERCIIERVIADSEKLGFDSMRVPVIDESFRQPAWPKRHTVEDIIKDKEAYDEIGQSRVWWREKMCKFVDPEAQMFKRENFRYYVPSEADTSKMNVFMTIDPASTTNEKSDNSCICVVGVTAEGAWYVLDQWAKRVAPADSMDAVFDMVLKWRPLVVGIESVAYQAALKGFLEKEMPRRQIHFSIKQLKAQNKKELRIETSLQPRYATGTIWHPWVSAYAPPIDWVKQLEKELLSFPRGLHDDRIDALAHMEQIIYAYKGVGNVANKGKAEVSPMMSGKYDVFDY